MAVKYDEKHQSWVLWEDSDIIVAAPDKPHWPAKWGGHIVVFTKDGLQNASVDYPLYSQMAVMAAVVEKALKDLSLIHHANKQDNGNWAWLDAEGKRTSFKKGERKKDVHIHIYGRRTDDPAWGDPIILCKKRDFLKEANFETWPENILTSIAEAIGDEAKEALSVTGFKKV